MSWLWIRIRRTGGFRFVTRLPNPSVHSTRGVVSSACGGAGGGPRDSSGTPDARRARAGGDTAGPGGEVHRLLQSDFFDDDREQAVIRADVIAAAGPQRKASARAANTRI